MDREKFINLLLQQGFKETTQQHYPGRYTDEMLKTYTESQHRYFRKKDTIINFNYHELIVSVGYEYYRSTNISSKTIATILMLSELRGAPQRYIFRDIPLELLYDRIHHMEISHKSHQKERLLKLRNRLIQILEEIVLPENLE